MTRGPSALPAKVVRPPCAGALARSRLFRLLDRARRRPVVWVSGPPGSGKTTLVSSYVEARRVPCLWYRADGGDADTATFFHYMGLAARAAGRGRGRRAPLPVPSPEFRQDTGTFARRYFEDLCDRLEGSALIVLDDLHEVPDESSFFEVVREGAARLSKGITLVLVSRAEPPPALVRLRARELMSRVGWDELRLTAAETKGMALRRGVRRAGADVLSRLHGLTDGWAAGVVLALSAAGGGRTRLPEFEGEAPSEIFEFFAEEILARFDERDRNLLLSVSVFPETTQSIAEDAFGVRGAGLLLSSLARRNAFVERRPGAEPSYRFHALFRAFLLAKARASLSPAEVLRLQRAAAAALERRDRPDEAEQLLREAQDWDGIARLVRDHASRLVAQGRVRTLAEWLSNVPAGLRDTDPWLSLWWARVRLPYDPEESRRAFEKAFGEFSERRDAAGVFLAWTGAVESIIFGSEGLKPLDSWIASLDGLLESFGGFPDEAVAARTTLAMVKALSLRRPPLASAHTWVERALCLAREADDGPLKVESLVNLAYYWYHGGEFRNTEAVLSTLRKMAGRSESSALSRLAAAWVEASYDNMHALYDRCLASVAAGLDLAAEAGIHVMDYMLMGHGALAALHKGDARAAREYFRSMEASLGSARPWEAAFYHFAAAWESLGRKDTGQARHHVAACLALCERVGNPWTTAMAHLARAFLLQDEGAFDASRASLAEARRLGDRHGLAFVRFASLLAEAFFHLERCEDGNARAPLGEGLRIGREKGYDGVFIWRPGFLERVAMKSLEDGTEAEYVRDLVRRNGLRPDRDRQDVEIWPWPLRIITLGSFEILREGKAISFDRKAPLRPLLMLKALIAFGGRNVPEGRLIDALWPDSEGDMAGQAFRVNLLRLRKLLGHDAALAVRDGCLTLDDRYCWLDAWSLERNCRRIEDVAAGKIATDDVDIVKLAERVAALYKGPFLPGDTESSWTSLARQRTLNLFVQSLLTAGERLERAGDLDRAAFCYRKGLEADKSARNLYEKFAACCTRRGKVSELAEFAKKIPRDP